MKDKIRILQYQMKVFPEKEQAIRKMEEACAKASAEKADLLALPEMFCCPYQTENFPLYAEEEGGTVFSACSEAAKKYGIWLSAGSMPERDTDGRIYNTAYVFDRSGRMAAKHRKMHLFNIDVQGGQRFRESDTLSAGNSVTVFDTEFGPVGLCVCYDLRFPELGRLMALKGARLLLVPAAFNMTTGPLHWELCFRAQAMFQQCFAVGTSPARDMEASYHAWGHSIAADPWGRVLRQLEDGEAYQLTALDLSETAAVRSQLPMLSSRRSDVYTLMEK